MIRYSGLLLCTVTSLTAGVICACVADRFYVGWPIPKTPLSRGLVELNQLCGLPREGIAMDPIYEGYMSDPLASHIANSLASAARPHIKETTVRVTTIPFGKGPQGRGWPLMSYDYLSEIAIEGDHPCVWFQTTIDGSSPVILSGWIGNSIAFSGAAFPACACCLAMLRWLGLRGPKKRGAFPVIPIPEESATP